MTEPFLIYVVEDNEWYNRLLVHSLRLNPDYEVSGFSSAGEVLQEVRQTLPDVVTIDYRLPDMNGDELLQKLKDIDASIEVVVISEQEEIETAVALLKNGAYDYLVKSKDIKDRILNTVQHIRENRSLHRLVKNLRREVGEKFSFEKTIIGHSQGIRKVFEMMEKATLTNITVSVSGETGTGKEMVAKAIHYNSPRKDKPFVALNVAAIPSELIESELFGFEKGAFTGAIAQRKGKFEEADGGTLFLDEIGEMDLNAQVKLLRVLQEREVTRIGSNTPVKVDCRIIVATHRNLQEEVKKGNFREDLFYRLIGIPVQLPPLRERKDDILLLAMHFIRQFCHENQLTEKILSEDAKQKLLAHQWPGNIRELRSVVELGVVMAATDEIQAPDLTLMSGEDLLPDLLTSEQTLREYSIRIVQFYLDKYDHDTKLVADKLGIGQTTVYRMLKEAAEGKNQSS